MSTKCKHPTLDRSSDDQDDHGPTDFDRLPFSTGQLGQRGGRLEAIQDDNRADQKKKINRGQSGPDRADWKTTILGEIES